MYAVRSTNQTGELIGVVEGLLWLLQVCGNNGNAIMLIDSLYAAIPGTRSKQLKSTVTDNYSLSKITIYLSDFVQEGM